jgi:hypothetical protein
MAATDHRMQTPPATILVIDIGGSKVKMLATGETAPRLHTGVFAPPICRWTREAGDDAAVGGVKHRDEARKLSEGVITISRGGLRGSET